MLDAYRATFARRVNELAWAGRAECNANVRRAWSDRRKEHQVASLNVVELHAPSELILIRDCSRNINSVLLEDIPHEAAAIESARRILATEPVGHALESQRQLHDRTSFRDRDRRTRRDVDWRGPRRRA